MSTRFDLDLFLQLNEEYRSKPIVPQPRSLAPASLLETSRKRALTLSKKLGGIEGKRVLEVGCGRGHFSRILADEYGCDVSGVDIREYPDWAERPDLSLHQHDIASPDHAFLGQFDVIVSFAVWEHVEHPYAALQATRSLLADHGKMYLYANLYRGPQASHRYREIFFPWPHLLFTDSVVEDFYVSLGRRPSRPAWVNKLTHAQYLLYFDQLGFDIEKTWVSMKPLDEDFYHRFEDQLGRYPRFDLERDFIYAIVTPRLADGETSTPDPRFESAPVVLPAEVDAENAALRRQVESLQADLEKAVRQRDRRVRELAALRDSRSWKVTEPLRRIKDRLS